MLFTKCATWQAVYLFPQILKTDFWRIRRLLVAPAPKPLFAEFHSAAAHRSGAFAPASGGDFLQTARLAYQHNRILPRKWKGQFFKKVRQACRAAASVKRCSKGLGCFPTSKTCGSRRCRKPQVLCVCIYKRPACPVVKACTVRQPSTKFSQRH